MLPHDFPFPFLDTAIASGDTMFNGQADQYLSVAVSALACIERVLDGRVPGSILDLPCGWGRVARILRARYPGASLAVCDIDPAAVGFVARTFDAEALVSTDDLRHLQLPGGYDLIWVGSLVTHLSEEQSVALLRTLASALSGEGVLVVSSHGPPITPALTSWGYGLPPPAVAGLLDDYVARGYGHRGYGGSTGYGISLTDRSWWRRTMPSLGLAVEQYDPQAWDGHHDIVVLRRGSGAAETELSPPAERERVAAYDPVMQVFDADFYLRTYPDVATAIGKGEVPSAFAHYVQAGRGEGRLTHQEPGDDMVPLLPERFDESWYLSANPDVRDAVVGGHIQSGLQHYRTWGRREGRQPSKGGMATLTEQERQERSAAAWSANPADAQGWYWMAHPMVRARVNAFASGDPAIDSYGRLKQVLQARGVTLPLGRAVSLGCGFGALERGLAAEGIIEEIDAYDIAPAAIAEARRLAAAAGLRGLRYHVADLETMAFPPAEVDVVFAHSSVHHVERLEQLFAAVAAMLKPGGLFHLNEFVGPTRFQWTESQMALVNRFLGSLPPRLRRLPSGQPRPLQARPTVAAMIAADPSESVRSSDIIPVLREQFDILEMRELGGAALHLGLAEIAQNFDPKSAEDQAILHAFFAAEDQAMRDGVVGSDFAVITAVARRSSTPARTEPKTPMPSLATRLSMLFPPARRLHEAVQTLNSSTARLSAENQALRSDQAAMRSSQAELAMRLGPPAASPPPPKAASVEPDTGEVDRLIGREMQSASLRHLPFLPGHIEMTDAGLRVEGYAGALEGLTEAMAFFVNGRRFNQVEYPVLDPELAARFTEVRGMGFVTRMTMTEHLDEIRAAMFWRLDASPTGHYSPHNWRQAIHFKNPAYERYPLPPEGNIKRVIGDTSAVRFAMGGAMIFKNIEHYLGEQGLRWSDFPRILDWGCGAGRVTRYLLGETGCAVTGVDIDPDNIAWCQASYPGARFETVPLRPPTALADGEFDLVVGLSVMTHLQEEDQWKWLAELRRVTRPGTLVFLSVQGPTQYAYNRFPPPLYRQVQEQGYLNLSRDGALDDVIADKEYYRAAMHSRPYIVQRWGEYFEVLAIVDAIAGMQDFVVMRRRN